jgi:hypothetical protein
MIATALGQKIYEEGFDTEGNALCKGIGFEDIYVTGFKPRRNLAQGSRTIDTTVSEYE